MSNTSIIEIEKFNGQNFELWKLKMEYLLVDQEKWIVVDLGTTPTSMLEEYWEKLNREAKSIIHLCMEYFVLLNLSGEETVNKLWDKLGNLY